MWGMVPGAIWESHGDRSKAYHADILYTFPTVVLHRLVSNSHPSFLGTKRDGDYRGTFPLVCLFLADG